MSDGIEYVPALLSLLKMMMTPTHQEQGAVLEVNIKCPSEFSLQPGWKRLLCASYKWMKGTLRCWAMYPSYKANEWKS